MCQMIHYCEYPNTRSYVRVLIRLDVMSVHIACSVGGK